MAFSQIRRIALARAFDQHVGQVPFFIAWVGIEAQFCGGRHRGIQQTFGIENLVATDLFEHHIPLRTGFDHPAGSRQIRDQSQGLKSTRSDPRGAGNLTDQSEPIGIGLELLELGVGLFKVAFLVPREELAARGQTDRKARNQNSAAR